MTLDDFGRRVWKHRFSKNLFAEQAYSWVDRVIILDETQGRSVVGEVMVNQLTNDWIPMTKEEFVLVERYYKDIYTKD